MNSPELFCTIMYVVGEKYLSITNENIYKLFYIDGIIGMILSILLQVITYFTINCKSISHFFSEQICDSIQDDSSLKTIIENFRFIKFKGIIISIVLILINFSETWSLRLLSQIFQLIISLPLILFHYFLIL